MREYLVCDGKYLFEPNIPIRTLYSKEYPYFMTHKHNFIEIAYIAEGEGIHYVADEIFTVSKGDLFFLPTCIPHVFQPRDLTGKRPLHVINCLFKPVLTDLTTNLLLQCRSIELAMLSHFINGTKWLAYRESSNEFIRLLQAMHNQQRKQNSGTELGILLLQLLSLLSQKPQLSYLHPPSKDEYPVHAAVQYMSTHFELPLSVSNVSQMVAISYRHFQRLFKLHTGRSFIQMLQEIRMNFACLLLLERKNDSIQSIAQKVGVFDMKHFYQLFHNHYGMTPAVFRLQHQSQHHAWRISP
ncbi:AraC family transcriptional regulator [Paenibacillus prosopidis]|uniref:AraC-like protein n=1 Tax=Paenibacillus prosopidis TaxID=630520 RepID=A0A368VP26_9BACL|nr:AraC family transcriptional regulator [Paenibacillus prosopidis]RCW43479.1 AraC-like protein [Paenibacillus prosopidis]